MDRGIVNVLALAALPSSAILAQEIAVFGTALLIGCNSSGQQTLNDPQPRDLLKPNRGGSQCTLEHP